MKHTAIPKDELKVFESLKDIKVVFDVGARDDVDYLIINPKIELHAFEPNPLFFKQLQEQVGEVKNVYLNDYGLGDVEGTFAYKDGNQAIGEPSSEGVLIRRFDSYIKEHDIDHIDFMKIDTEGYELNVLRGAGSEADGYALLKICRYIQYEGGTDNSNINSILKKNGFSIHYTGYRNHIAVRDGELMPWIPEFTQEGGLTDKDESNRLHNI